jgi:hypothetical protein
VTIPPQHNPWGRHYYYKNQNRSNTSHSFAHARNSLCANIVIYHLNTSHFSAQTTKKNEVSSNVAEALNEVDVYAALNFYNAAKLTNLI